MSLGICGKYPEKWKLANGSGIWIKGKTFMTTTASCTT
jgi:hypothetical protein